MAALTEVWTACEPASREVSSGFCYRAAGKRQREQRDATQRTFPRGPGGFQRGDCKYMFCPGPAWGFGSVLLRTHGSPSLLGAQRG